MAGFQLEMSFCKLAQCWAQEATRYACSEGRLVVGAVREDGVADALLECTDGRMLVRVGALVEKAVPDVAGRQVRVPPDVLRLGGRWRWYGDEGSPWESGRWEEAHPRGRRAARSYRVDGVGLPWPETDSVWPALERMARVDLCPTLAIHLLQSVAQGGDRVSLYLPTGEGGAGGGGPVLVRGCEGEFDAVGLLMTMALPKEERGKVVVWSDACGPLGGSAVEALRRAGEEQREASEAATAADAT